MAIAEIVDSLDGVHESIREDYEKGTDGKFYFKPIAGLKANNAALIDEKRKLAEKHKKFEGIDDATFEEMKSVHQQHKESKLTDTEKAQKALKEREDRIASLEAAIKTGKLKDGLRGVMVKSGMFEDDIEDALALNIDKFDIDKDGKIIPKDATLISAEKFFNETYKQQRPKFYRPEGGSGSGASGGQRSGSAPNTITRAAFTQLDPGQQMAHIKAGGKVAD
ncbi:MAG TPA: hypothetical protein VF762_10995 [Blastocatellia bacterium]|jgi:hypothetical protein